MRKADYVIKGGAAMVRRPPPLSSSSSAPLGDEMQIDESSQNLPGPIGNLVKSYRITGIERFKDTDYVINGLEDQVFLLEFEFLCLLCGYKTPNRTVEFIVRYNINLIII